MRWFKHMTGSRRDEKLAQMRDEFGMAGYGLWWTVLEIIGEQMGKDGKTSVAYSAKRWRNLTETYPKTFKVWLTFCESLSLLSWKSDDGLITVDIPNLAKYRDEYTSKEVRKSGPAPEQIRSDSGTEAEADINTESTTHTSTNSQGHVGPGQAPGGCVCGEDDSPPPGGSPQPKPPIQNEPEYSQEFFEFMAIYGEPPNDGAWLAWCAVCRRTNFTALWRANLDSWLDCDRWQRNFKKDAKNFLRDGDWQRKAPEAPALPAGEGPRANSVSDIAALERDKMARDVVENRRRRYEQNGDVRNNRGGNQGSLPAAPASQDEHGPGEDHGLALAGGPGGGA